jgi:hypothetical protein
MSFQRAALPRPFSVIVIGLNSNHYYCRAKAGAVRKMPLDTHLVAITSKLGNYSVSSQFDGPVARIKLRQSGRLIDVSEPNSGYGGYAAILSPFDFYNSSTPTVRQQNGLAVFRKWLVLF